MVYWDGNVEILMQLVLCRSRDGVFVQIPRKAKKQIVYSSRKVMITVLFQGLCSPPQPRPQMSVKGFTSHRHFQLVEGVFHHIVRVQLVDLVDDGFHIAGHGVRKEQEFSAGQRLKTRQSEFVRLEIFQA